MDGQGFASARYLGSASVGTPNAVPDREMLVDMLRAAVDANNKFLYSTLEQLRSLVDSLVGGGTPPENPNQKTSAPTGRLFGLGESIQGTEAIARLIQDQVDRLRGL